MTRYFIYCFKKSKKNVCIFQFLCAHARMHVHIDVAMTMNYVCIGHLLSEKTWKR